MNHHRLSQAILSPRSFAFRSPDLDREVSDQIATIRVDRDVLLTVGSRSWPIQLDPEARKLAATSPRALWVCNFSPQDGEGSVAPFAPPQTLDWKGSIPLRVSDSVGLELGDGIDLLRSSMAVSVGDRQVAIVGQRRIAAANEADARHICLYLADGRVLEVRLVVVDSRAWFEYLKFVYPSDAHSGPNVIFDLADDAKLEVTRDSSAAVPTSQVLFLLPQRSSLFDVWARYAALQIEAATRKEKQRGDKSLRFQHATAQGDLWYFEAQLDDNQVKVWLGEELVEGQRVKIDQAVYLSGDVNARFTIEEAEVRTSVLCRFSARPMRGTTRLPEHGELFVAENKGSKVARQRELRALDTLLAGRAACSGLFDLLIDPTRAKEAVEAPLMHPPQEPLDEPQTAALRTILGCRDIVAIQGPPGTGKTRVIAEALRQLALRRGPNKQPLRVLISSVQNEAIENVKEKAAKLAGILLHVVKSRARSDEEQFRLARQQASSAEPLVRRLEARLGADKTDQNRRGIRDLASEVNGLRTLLASKGSGNADEIADALDAIASCGLEFLGLEHRRIAKSLAEELRVLRTTIEPRAETTAMPFPASPSEVVPWWTSARATWPTESRLDVEMLVERIQTAAEGARTNPLRYERKLRDLFAELGTFAPPKPDTPAADTPAGTPLASTFARVDAWCAMVGRELNEHEDALRRTPDAIAHRFLLALKEDASTWEAILARHNTTTGATCSMADILRNEEDESFDWVIIDEAGRASPFELLVPMVQGKRIVLIGDHRQLPPTVEDEVLAQIELDSAEDIKKETLFSTLFDKLPPLNRRRLSIQYRMNGRIGRYVNELFYMPYNEPLASYHSGAKEVERRPLWGVLDDKPLVWFDRPPARNDAVYESADEAEAVIGLLKQFALASNPPDTIAVICAYSRQRKRVEARVRMEGALLANVVVATIDQVQGREYEVVLLCTTRVDGSPGFMAVENRMNVALSRACRQLVIIGSYRTFAQSSQVRRRAPHVHRLTKMCWADGLVVT